ncbi:hypothetical protein SAY87_030494 [Trapa incisa]|uniref:Homeobox domain-containing protein n=1 Tax=Trapa incisa TaxID=236973 RepID=A0AAN7KNC4_9MYRT|nr:hypothetical protein SAY87_030494 [Trapa incisa]
MASSNRHWPNMFKSKPHQWQHEVNQSLISTGCHRSQYSSGCEERTPEPKPRWNPKPEQVRILEAIFDSGMVNPPRDEIRKIRAQLQEYGQVGDANVFYWFQNRKSRSKHKLRHLQNSNKQQNRQLMAVSSALPTSSTTVATTAPSSSSSSTDNKPSSKGNFSGGLDRSCASTMFTLGPSNMSELLNCNSSNFSLGQPVPYFPSHEEIHSETFPPFPASQGFFLSEPLVPFHGQPVIGPCGSLFLSETMVHGGASSNKKVKINPNATASSSHDIAPLTASETFAVPFMPSSNQVHDLAVAAPGIGGGFTIPKVAVFINDVAFEVTAEPFNVQAAFGNDAVLINSAGQPVVTDEWGLTLQPLQHGAFYYLVGVDEFSMI